MRKRRSIAGKSSFIAEPGKPTIIMTRVFDAPRRLGFEAWTKPERFVCWWGPNGL